MSSNELDKYKDLYSQLITAFAELHNANLSFLVARARDKGFATRKQLREVEDLAKQLKRQCQLVNKESLANYRAEKQIKREQKKVKKDGKRNRTT